jgi:hypothetical protein
MDHQPFEQWIFDDNLHSGQQDKLLLEHLEQCNDCVKLDRAWAEIEKELQKPVMLAPSPGFSNRFQSRLAERLAEEHHKQAIKSLVVIGTGILITMAAFVTWLIFSHSIGDVIVQSVSLFSNIVQTFFNFRSMMVQFLRHTPAFTPYLIWIMIAGWGAILASLWGMTVWKLSRQGMVQK